MGTTARRDLKIKRGDTFSLVLRLRYFDEGTDGELPLDLTGSILTITMQATDSGQEWAWASTGPEWDMSGEASGEATFTLSDAVTNTLPEPNTRMRWSLKRAIDGTVTTHIAGNVTMIDWTVS